MATATRTRKSPATPTPAKAAPTRTRKAATPVADEPKKKPVVRRKRATASQADQVAAATAPVVIPTGDDTAENVGMGGGMILAAVPPKSLIKEYVGRKLAGGGKDFDLLDVALEENLPVLIEGPTGSSKTMFTRTWAALRDVMLARVPCNVGIEPSQMFGKFIPNDDSTPGAPPYVWVDGPVTHVVRNGGVVLINEANFMPDRVASVLFGLLDANKEIVLQDHKGEVVKAHRPNCWCDLDAATCKTKWVVIVADMNPDYSGTRPLNAAFRNRFALQQVWDYDAAVEKQLVKSKSLLDFAKQVRDRIAKGDFETPLSTNMLMEFERLALSRLGLPFAINNLINHFQSIERDSLKVVMQAHEGNIAKDLAPPKPEAKATTKSQPVITDDDDSKYDPEWGIRGMDWVYADEAAF